MGAYLVPELLAMGYGVDAVSLDEAISDNSRLNCIKADAKDNDVLNKLLKNEYNGIVDFMIYTDPERTLGSRLNALLRHTDHYIYLSSYRIYSDKDATITENTPRLLDVAKDTEFLAEKTREYSLYKAMGENMLAASGYKNWTAVRPAITYSKRRFQLTTLEAPVVVHRMRAGKTVLLPKEAMTIEGTMSWAGDVAKMLARLLLNPQAFSQAYTVATAEHHPWMEIADYYGKIGGLRYETADTETFLNVWAPDSKFASWQLRYDRFFNRRVNNRKILDITGMKQSELMPLMVGLKLELSALPVDYVWDHSDINDRMDAYFAVRGKK